MSYCFFRWVCFNLLQVTLWWQGTWSTVPWSPKSSTFSPLTFSASRPWSVILWRWDFHRTPPPPDQWPHDWDVSRGLKLPYYSNLGSIVMGQVVRRLVAREPISFFVPGQHDPERHQLGSERGGPSTHPEQVLRTCRGSATGHHQETGLNRFVSPPIPYWLNSNTINKWSNSHPLFNSSSQSRSSWASEMDIFDAFKINLLSIDDETRNKN